ncbi:hypothetical protein LGM58_38395 [Burkholderia contaminans]|uniref:hypothetical protein n=1 Tax=Burkholderia contaminans TaxID=488447 RepID=UPI001CF5C464|nr:hypothetical protein [Burkholderia contaminans]MCA7889054.1 hypothetical protein [Burkholderia contaminans]
MIDVFLRVNTPIPDIPKALAGFDCSRVLVRNGGPTEVWKRTADRCWMRDQPGMTLYEDLRPDYIDLAAFLSRGVVTGPVGDGMPLLLDPMEAREWLAAMEQHRYAFEDAIGCTVGVEHEDKDIVCAAAHFGLSEFKSMMNWSSPLAQRILVWSDRALAAGADEICASVAIAKQQ